MRPLLALVCAAALPVVAAAPRQEVPAAVRALAGIYRGEWKMFGLDGEGHAVERASWADVQTAGDPKVEGDRAYVTTHDVMTFAGKGGTREWPGREGYLLGKDGAPADYYMENAGAVTKLQHIADDVWTYTADAAAYELAGLGLPKDAKARHVLVKVVGQEGGHETHRITRITTARWSDAAGTEHVVQFTSLQGFHRKD